MQNKAVTSVALYSPHLYRKSQFSSAPHPTAAARLPPQHLVTQDGRPLPPHPFTCAPAAFFWFSSSAAVPRVSYYPYMPWTLRQNARRQRSRRRQILSQCGAGPSPGAHRANNTRRRRRRRAAGKKNRARTSFLGALMQNGGRASQESGALCLR